MRLITQTIAAGLISLMALGANAQVNPEVSEFATQIEAMRTIMQTERKILIMQEMALTAEEAEQFWPLYDEYNAEVKKVGDLRVKAITDYAANYMSMTDELADQLIKDSISYEEKRIKLKKKYVKKFDRVLPSLKVARYMQLENKLDAIIDFDLAAEIPLME
jgi:uncharacterized protein YvpB